MTTFWNTFAIIFSTLVMTAVFYVFIAELLEIPVVPWKIRQAVIAKRHAKNLIRIAAMEHECGIFGHYRLHRLECKECARVKDGYYCTCNSCMDAILEAK